MEKFIAAVPTARIDYIALVEIDTFEPLNVITKGKTLLDLAVFIGKTRLIDNVEV